MSGLDWVLREDALEVTGGGVRLHIGLPWLRSLPLSCLLELQIRLDDRDVPEDMLLVGLDGERTTLTELRHTAQWWFLQDRITVDAPATVPAGTWVDVDVSCRLLLPYLRSGPERPAILPFGARRRVRAHGTPSERRPYAVTESESTWTTASTTPSSSDQAPAAAPPSRS